MVAAPDPGRINAIDYSNQDLHVEGPLAMWRDENQVVLEPAWAWIRTDERCWEFGAAAGCMTEKYRQLWAGSGSRGRSGVRYEQMQSDLNVVRIRDVVH